MSFRIAGIDEANVYKDLQCLEELGNPQGHRKNIKSSLAL